MSPYNKPHISSSKKTAPENLKDDMQGLVHDLIAMIIDFPEDLSVASSQTSKTIMFEISVRKEDVGKIIGKEGRTARSLRTIFAAIAARYDMRCLIDVVE